MKTLATKEVNYSLHNSENYKKELDYEISDVVCKFSELIVDYFKLITENVKFKKTNFSRFIITRGLSTITSVFNYILLYTKNLDLTYFHCQKAFYFYVEFVGQISEDEKMILQLSSRDATTYVYKKTIFEISNELKKNNENISDYTQLKLDIINLYIELYERILFKLIDDDFTDLEKLNSVQTIYSKLNALNNKSNINILSDIIGRLYFKIENVTYFLDACLILSKKISKHQEQISYRLDKFLEEDFKNKLEETPDKFVSWLLN